MSIRSSLDGSEQPAFFYMPSQAAKVDGNHSTPLLVCLHSWSSDFKTADYFDEVRRECVRRGWIFISPDFRGPNNRPEACASKLAIQDVLDAVKYAKQLANVDEHQIYLLGGSGGGHMALMMAQRAPEVWTAVSAWVPITDLAAWHQFSKQTNSRYFTMMEQCCGGAPDTPARQEEYRRRSPLNGLGQARSLRIAIDSGIQDGHGGASVPLSHSLRAFNVLAEANGHKDLMLTEEDIRVMTQEARIPEHLAQPAVEEPVRKHKVLFRRQAGPVRLTIFDGGHLVEPLPAMEWLATPSIPPRLSRSGEQRR